MSGASSLGRRLGISDHVIGLTVVDGYIREGPRVAVVDDLSSGRLENVHPDAVFYREDIRSEAMGSFSRTDIHPSSAGKMPICSNWSGILTGDDRFVPLFRVDGLLLKTATQPEQGSFSFHAVV